MFGEELQDSLPSQAKTASPLQNDMEQSQLKEKNILQNDMAQAGKYLSFSVDLYKMVCLLFSKKNIISPKL